jgi:hypothetical protein
MLSERERLRIASLIAADVEGGFVEVTDGAQTVRVPVQNITVTADSVIVEGTFGEAEANFEWTDRRILTANGELVDSDPGDHGRKVAGSVWGVQAVIKLTTN